MDMVSYLMGTRAAGGGSSSTVLGNFAGAFSASVAYTAGQYVTYTDGKFYRFTADHAAGSWTGTDVVAVTAGGELSDLKSIFDVTQKNVLGMVFADYPTLFDKRNVIDGYYYDFATGEVKTSLSRFIQPFVPCKPSTTYWHSTCNIAIYDAGGTFINTIMYNDPATFTTSADAAFFGVSMTTVHIDLVKIVEGSAAATTQPTSKLSTAQVEGLANYMKSLPLVDDNTYSATLPDANSAPINSYAVMHFTSGSTSIAANLPFSAWSGRLAVLITFNNETNGYRRQLFIHETDTGITMYCRSGVSASSYRSWMVVNDDYFTQKINALEIAKPIVVDANGGGDYTSLTEAMRENATQKCDIYVRPGVYDLYTEIIAYEGAGYFDDASFSDQGLEIKNGTRVFLDANAVIQFNYTGSNERVITRFSPFKFSDDGGELHGGQIVCSNCRYAIHDDCYTTEHDRRVTEGVYIYYRSDRNVAIGGGLGKSSHVELKNCYVDSGTYGYGVFYHNNSESNQAQNFVSIHDNYFTADIVIEPLGPSELISKSLVSNNKAKAVRRVIPSSVDNPSDIDNFEMVSWNNVTAS